MVIVLPPVWISVLFTLTVNANDKAYDTTGCHEVSGCSGYNLTCTSDDKIQINTVEYRYKKKNVCGACGNECCSGCERCETKCCSFDNSDCQANYSELHAQNLYNKCSGKTSCAFPQTEPPLYHVCDEYNGTKYIHFNYGCIPSGDFINVCNGNVKNIRNKNVIFSPSNKSASGSMLACKCSIISTGNKRVSYKLVDIRLFNVTDPSGGFSCSDSILQIAGNVIKCTEKNSNFTYMGSSNHVGEIELVDGNNEVVVLNLGDRDFPQMIWIYLNSNSIFDINCSSESVTTQSVISTTTDATSFADTGATIQLQSTTKGSTGLSSGMASTLSTRYSSTEHKLPISAQENKGQTLSIILGVIGGAIILTIVAVVILLYKRRQKKITEKAASKIDLPNGIRILGSTISKESDTIFEPVESSNYDLINDESIVTYCHPVKKKNNSGNIVKDETEYGGHGATDKYERIEFERKVANTTPNYDSLPVMEGGIHDDTYAHASSQANSDHTYNTNNFSRFELYGEDLTRKEKCTKTAVKDDNLKDEDYSHVDLEVEWKKERQPAITEEDSYIIEN